jgi:hypothetical protein
MSITSQHLGHDVDDNNTFDMDVEDNETKMFEERATQTEPQQKRKLAYQKLLEPTLEPQHMASSAASSSSAVRTATQEYFKHAELSAQARRSAEDLKIEADKKLEDEIDS